MILFKVLFFMYGNVVKEGIVWWLFNSCICEVVVMFVRVGLVVFGLFYSFLNRRKVVF